MLQHKMNAKDLKPGLVASYDIWPGNGVSLFSKKHQHKNNSLDPLVSVVYASKALSDSSRLSRPVTSSGDVVVSVLCLKYNTSCNHAYNNRKLINNDFISLFH